MTRIIAGSMVWLAAAVACGARSGTTDRLQADTRPLLYVCNQEGASVSVIDMTTDEVIRTIDLEHFGFPPTAKPHHIVAEPDGSFWYLSLIGAGKVVKFDREDRVVGEADFETPGMLVIDPADDRLFVGRSMSAVNPPSRVGAVRRTDMSLEEIEVVFPRPHMMVVDPAGKFLYTASLGENRIMIVRVDDQEVTSTAVEGAHHVLAHAAISPDGSRLAVSGEHTAKLLVFDATRSPELTPLAVLDVNPRPWHLAFSPDGRFVYFGNQGANTVTVVDAARWTVAAVIRGEGLAEPHGIAVSSDGRRVYVSNRNLKGAYSPKGGSPGSGGVGNVVVIDARARSIVKVIDVGPGPSGIAIVPGY